MKTNDFCMTDESLAAYLRYYYNYSPEGAQALIDRNRDADNRKALEDIIQIKKAN